MAGLQYNFFPTDFFYPPTSLNRVAAGPQVLPAVIKPVVDVDETTGDIKVQSIVTVSREIKKKIVLRARPSSFKPLFGSADKKEVNEFKSNK